MPDNFDPANEIMVGNRRLRKIKRPRIQTGPYTEQFTQPEYSQTPQNTQYEAEPQPEYSQNNVNTPQYGNAPQPQSNLPYVQQEPVYQETNQSQYIEEDPYSYANVQAQNEVYYNYDAIDKKKVLFIALACLFIGILAGKFLLGSEHVVQNGLQGIVMNPEVPQGRSRCGVAEKTQGCVLYVMNPQRQELNGRDFYDLASQLTGRQRFVIETGNMRYSSMKIKPGFIAQLNIPPLQ